MKICSGCQKPLEANAPDGLCPECLLKAGLGTGADRGPDSQADSGRTPFVAPSLEEVARLFPQVEILGFIGQGGMGAVYKARQKALDRIVALKILPPGIRKDPAFAERFTREAKALARLNHPGVVTIYEFGQADGLFFFLMEFVDGMSLRHLLEVERISAREALAIVPQICDALQYAHDQGIVHRDIKPENILLDRQGRVKVADFGLAKLAEMDAGRLPLSPALSPSVGEEAPGLTDAGKVMGTPQYMAPEQREHPTEVDHRADIYSLGVVFYQMLTGELPGKPIEAPSHKVQIDVRLDEVVLRALEKEPQRRYQQVSQVKTAVETIAQSPTPARPANSTNASPPRLLKGDAGFVTTPEQLGTFEGQLFLWHRRSQLLLDERQLTVSRAGAFTVIPLAAIRDLSIGHYGRVLHPAGLDFISVTYDADGQTQRLYFSPYESWFRLPSYFNRIVAEWFNAIRAAVLAATGREPGNTPAEQLGVPSGSKALYALLLAPVVLGGTLVSALVWKLGGAASQSFLSGLLISILGTLALAILALLVFGRFFRGSHKHAAATPGGAPGDAGQGATSVVSHTVAQAGGKWPLPLVGLRNGQRVIHWPGLLLFAVLIVAVAVAVSLTFHVLLPVKGSLGLLVGLVVGFVLLTIKLQQAWTTPIERLPRLDAPERPKTKSLLEIVQIMLGVAILIFGVIWSVMFPKTQDVFRPDFVASVAIGLGLFCLGIGVLIVRRANAWRVVLSVALVEVVLLSVFLVSQVAQGYKVMRRLAADEAREAERRKAAQPAAAESRFRALVPQGEIELVGISYHPSTNQPWWRPDGSSCPEGPFEFRDTLNSATREFVIRLTGLPSDASRPVWELVPFCNRNGGMVIRGGQPVPDLWGISAVLPKSARSVTVKVGIAIGAWETVAKQVPGGASMTEVSRQSSKWVVSFPKPDSTEGYARVLVVHTMNDRNMVKDYWDIRVLALDDGGKEYTSGMSESSGTDAFSQITTTFPTLPLERVREFQFQVRPYQWVEFRDVALYPKQPLAGSGAMTFGPVIERVTVRGNEAVIEGQGRLGGELWLGVGYMGPGWRCSLASNLPFSATVKCEGNVLRFTRANQAGTVEQKINLGTVGPWVPPGQVVFREGQLSPEADGGYIIAYLHPQTGVPRGPDLPPDRRPLPISLRAGGASRAESAGSQGFGPVIERVVPRLPPGAGNSLLLDLDSGRWSTNANFHVGPDTPSRQREWLRRTGADLAATPDPKFPIIIGYDMVLSPAESSVWETATPADVLNDSSLMTTEREETSFADKAKGGPETYFFRTREDGRGVLQVLGNSTNPPGVKIRYKLVETASKPAVSWQRGFRAKAEWQDAGAGTPEAALHTLLWAGREQALTRLDEIVFLPRHPGDEWYRSYTNDVPYVLGRIKQCSGVTLADVNYDTSEVAIIAMVMDGIPPNQVAVSKNLRMIRVGTEWKCDYPHDSLVAFKVREQDAVSGSPLSSPPPLPLHLPKEAWTNAGANTWAAALQSYMWAVRENDYTKLKEMAWVPPSEEAEFKKEVGKFFSLAAQCRGIKAGPPRYTRSDGHETLNVDLAAKAKVDVIFEGVGSEWSPSWAELKFVRTDSGWKYIRW